MLWMVHEDRRLSKKAAATIDGTLPSYHSLVSFWEIGIKLSGRGYDFIVDDDWERLYPEELTRVRVPLLTPTIEDCRLVQNLPTHHRDPFDRMLVCQAMRHGLGIISADTSLDAYGIERMW
jgi:PIN domain nuclease of toxin-antitoxin system